MILSELCQIQVRTHSRQYSCLHYAGKMFCMPIYKYAWFCVKNSSNRKIKITGMGIVITSRKVSTIHSYVKC